VRRALLVLIVALAVVPVSNDACCDLDQPAALAQTAAADPACPLHAHGGSGSTASRPEPSAPVRCAHELSIDRAGLVKTVALSAPIVTAVMIGAPAPDLVAVSSPLSSAAPHHPPPRRASRPDVLRI